MQADPNSLYYRAPHVMVAAVTGAPGDGNFSLTAQMRDKLSHLGPIIQDFRRTVLYGLPPEWGLLGLATLASVAWLLGGYALFKRLETGFADIA